MIYMLFVIAKRFFIFLSILAFSISALAMNGRTTYQAKISKPDGYPLEAASVNFRFTVLDTVGSCILYIEDYAAINMQDTGGLVSFALGNGTRAFPTSGTSQTFQNIFDNSVTSFPCQNAGVYNPGASDTRRIVMQFNEGVGWQTLPAMTINAVPYSMYASTANIAKTLNNKADTAFVEYATLAGLNCQSHEALKFNGASFSCIPVAGITASGSVLTIGGTASAPVISMSAASMSSDGYLTSLDYAEFKAKIDASSTQIISTLGFAPVSASAVTAQIASTNLSGDVSGSFSSNSVVGVGGKTAAQVSTSVDDTLAATASNTASTIVKRNAQSGVGVNYLDIYKPTTAFNVRLQAPTGLAATYTLTLPASGGTSGEVLTTDGSGNLSWINAAAAAGGVASVSATAPLSSTGGLNPSISITQATSTTNGYLSSVHWNIFNDKQAATSAAIIATLGYTPADNAVSGTYAQKANNLSDLANIVTARTNLGLGSLAVANSIDLGSASATGIIADARLADQSGVTSGTQYTKVTVDGKGRVTIGSQLSTSDVTTALGFTPANNAASGTYAQKANNLSDLANIVTARTNLGLGSLAVANSIDLGSASATGIIADARLADQSALTSGTQYTKVTVDGKGRVINASQLSTSDVTTALGYTPASATASTQWNTSGTTINYTNGNVGLGHANPQAALDILSGSLRFSTLLSGQGITGYSGGGVNVMNLIREDALGTGGLTMTAYGGIGLAAGKSGPTTNYDVYIKNNSYVGIGVSAPVEKLDVDGSIVIKNNHNLSWGGAYGTSIPTIAAGVGVGINFYPSGSSAAYAMQIAANGNVGINTATPSYPLDVTGTIRASTLLFHAPPGDPSPLISTRTVPAGQGAAAEKTEMILFHSNDFNNGSGVDQITLRAPALSFQTYTNAAVADINDNNGYNERMYINPAGDVGIGTTTPSAKLDVQGQVKTSMGTPLVNPAGNAVDFATGNTQYVTFSTCPGNALTVNFFSMYEGSSYSIVIIAPNGCVVDFTGISHPNGGAGGVAVTSFKYPAGQKFSSTGNPMVYSFLRANNFVFVAQVVDFQ